MAATSPCSVTLLVGPDCLGPALRDVITRASARLDVAVYEVGPAYAWMLGAAAARGVAVRLLVDDHPGVSSGGLDVLRRAVAPVGVRVAGGRPGGEAHWKMVVAGPARGATVALGTGNLDLRDAPYHGEHPAGTRELWVTVSGHPLLARLVRSAIGSAWSVGRHPPALAGPATQPRVPPVADPGTHVVALRLEVPRAAVRLRLGGAAVATLLVERLNGCHSRALVCVPYVHGHVPAVAGLVAALAAAAHRGADARLLLGADPRSDASASTPDALAAAGVGARVMDPRRVTTGHAKVAVIDGALVCSSANWSAAGLGTNLEAALDIDDERAAGHVAAVFDHDWRESG